MTLLRKPTIFAMCLTALALFTLAPRVIGASSNDDSPRRMAPVYGFLKSRVSVSCCTYTSLVTVSFKAVSAVNASIHFSVGTFIPANQCCQGAYLELISVDNGTPGGAQGLGCGGQTSQFTGNLIGVSCFGRLSFAAGAHSVTLVLYLGGGGPFTVEAGPSTAILLEFD